MCNGKLYTIAPGKKNKKNACDVVVAAYPKRWGSFKFTKIFTTEKKTIP